MATRTVALSQGLSALVDDDYEEVGRFKWSASRCHRDKFVAMRTVRVGTKTRTVYMARWLLGLEHGDPLEADHLNHDTLDNRRSNLKIVTATANKQRQPSRGGSSRFVGVTFDRGRNRWRAQIQHDGVMRNLGRYPTEADAVAARDAWVVAHATAHTVNVA